MAIHLTGRIRYRVQTRMFDPALVVLQVEYEGTDMQYSGGSVDSVDVKGWRDATVEDLTEKERAA